MKRKNNCLNAHRRARCAARLIVCLLPLLLCACARDKDRIVIIAGSTSVQPYAELLAEEFATEHTDSEIDIQGGGSSAGITAAQTGAADVGMSSRDLSEKEQGLWAVEIAKDGLAVVVHPDNPVAALSLEQIRGIYTGTLTYWSALGGNEARIHVITREEGSGTRSAFESLVMGADLITPKAIVQDSNGAVKQLVSDDINAIGFISLGLVDQLVVAVKLDGVEATQENVRNGTYNLSRPFLFVAQSQPEGFTKEFVDYVLSPEGQRILEIEGLISMEGEAQAQELAQAQEPCHCP